MKTVLKKTAISSLAACLTIALVLVSCSRTNTAKSGSQTDSQEQIAAEVARQVAEQLAAASQTAVAPQTAAASQPTTVPVAEEPEKETVAGTPAAEKEAEEKPHVWNKGGAAPNGGLVYFAQEGEFYEAMAPANTVGLNDSLPAGWVAPDMEDLGLIYAGLQKTGAADYGNVYYYSVSKVGGKNRFLRMSDGKEATDVTVGRKVGVRKFDPSQPPAKFDKAVLVYTPSAAEKAAATADKGTAATTPAAAEKPAATPKYAIGAEGPGGGTVFSASGGKYKEVGPDETEYGMLDRKFKMTTSGGDNFAKIRLTYNGFSNWRIPTIEELQLIYTNLHKPGLRHFSDGWVMSVTVDNSDIMFIPGFPEYKIYYAGSGDTYAYFSFTFGVRRTPNGMREFYPTETYDIPALYLYVRDF